MTSLVKKTESTDQEFVPDALRIAHAAWRFKAGRIKAYDMRELSVLSDCFVLCSATSDPQLKAIFNGVKDSMREVGIRPLKTEGQFDSNWLVLDYGNIMVHIFRESAWEFYDLEGLWADATEIELDLDEE